MAIDPLEVTTAITDSYRRYLKTSFRLRDRALAGLFHGELEKFQFVNGPILEATPPFKVGCSLSMLAREGLFDPLLTDLICESQPYLRAKPLYLHQERAIRKILGGRNVVITSGTSSGKTECFLIPILNHLVREHREGKLGPGVRALLLYPMNALANDQLRRLRDLGDVFAKRAPDLPITFGRYVGDSKKTKKEALEKFKKEHDGKGPAPGELLSREEMQASPPHILLTNYAMLEYLLLRPEDCSFFEGETARHWRFLVLDEAHTYNGATGIEMGMLIRRLKDRICGSVPGRLQCIATSATLVSAEADSPKVAEFARNLFGEAFEWEPSDQNRQDVVRGERQPHVEPQISFTPLPSLYVELENVRQYTKDESGLRDQFLKICADRGTPEAILTKAAAQRGTAARLLYEILSHDLNLSKLKQFIERPRKFDECCKELFGSDAGALKCLVDLAAWAKPDDESLPLLPARYHLFVRAPEGAFLSFYPTRKIFLERRERTAEGNPVFELASCRRCGQEYLVGRLCEGKLTHSQSDPEVRTKTIRYYLLRSFASCEEDEDETVALPENDVNGRAVKLCFKCGTVCEGDQAPSCGCGGDYVQELVEAKPKDGVLNKCLLCGLRSIDIVREFVFQQDAPAAVLATALYQKLGKDDPKARKILCFSDSRQDAAFFAPYLEGTYERILYRRLMMEALGQNRGVADYRLESLVEDVLALANSFDLLDRSLDEKQKRKLIWKYVLQEFCAMDRRICLEGVGLVAFVPIMPKMWEPPEGLLHGKLNLSRAEAAALYHILLNTLRLNMAVTFPQAGPAPNDEAFAPRNHEYRIRGEGSDPKSGIYSWAPATSRLNTRLQFLMKLYQPRNGRQEIDSEARKLLGMIWEDLTARWKGQGIEALHDRRHGTLFQLDYRFWRVLHGESAAADWYVCERCGGFSPVSVRGVCSTFGCDGKLTAIEHSKAQTAAETNHYRHLYKTLSIAKMAVHEHTAQLKQDFATDVQLKFINGDINVLSCSTTFELGVDLGELETIFMRNVPPEPSNYIQRAGRAGRRTGSAGFTFTFARLRPHDLNYFARPEELVGGYVKPPAVEIVNEKIVRRHLHAVALSEFWKLSQEHFGDVNKFFGLGAQDPSSTDGFECFRNFLQQKNPQSLMEALKRITPPEMQPVFDFGGWRWVEELFDPNEGPLEIARKAICSDYDQIDDFCRDKKQELHDLDSSPGTHTSQRGKLNRDIDWAERTLKTIEKRNLIDFLATHGVLPKYGFPVDVVELTALHHAPAAKRIQLERDLRIAISEFAPGSQVVANGYLWKSAALKVVKGKTWDIFWYAVCPASGCNRFQMKRATVEEVPLDLTCEACGNNIPRGHIHRMLVPIFGFTTSREVEPIRPGEARPRRDFSTRPYFVTHESKQQCEHSIGELVLNCEYSPRGELAVVCKGKKGQGFKVCFDCGYAISTVEGTKTSHRTPLGRDCIGPLRSPWHLGHSFQTDLLLLSVTTKGHSGMPSLRKDESFWLSFLYSLLEGASEALGIRRRDLDGCLYLKPDQYGLVLFDTVPGGAGHVRRLMDESNLRATLRASKARVEPTEAHNCGEETSCYGCLRNYDNQFCHDQLRRGPVLRFLRECL